MSAIFELVGKGVNAMPDPADNPDRHVIPHHGSGTRIGFEVLNVGINSGNASVRVELDDTFVANWESKELGPGEREIAYLSVGRLDEGQHTVLIHLNAGSGKSDTNTETFNVR
ncbi:hypothetical protein [Nitrosospira sp. Is2]|uniref:hypothetical protein n=1 Tax=Nitrosospira sp. Is2 TaxID=3080532 RepID=UPI002953CEA7|nr:hypothetical protein [Nitrosospira sp. Is2]WON73526.1 hypothetical protein R5L00_13750 [Nitrosospira sp. Is2]